MLLSGWLCSAPAADKGLSFPLMRIYIYSSEWVKGFCRSLKTLVLLRVPLTVCATSSLESALMFFFCLTGSSKNSDMGGAFIRVDLFFLPLNLLRNRLAVQHKLPWWFALIRGERVFERKPWSKPEVPRSCILLQASGPCCCLCWSV